MEEIKSIENKKKKLIDFNYIYGIAFKKRKTFFKVLPCVLLGTYLLTLCMPRYYTSTVILAPESNDISTGGLSSTLSSLGMGALSKLGNNDAISPELYPALLSSNDFIIQMFPIKVKDNKGKLETTYYDYLAFHQKSAWWSKVIGFFVELIKPTPEDGMGKNREITVFNMSKKQQDIAKLIAGNINCTIDQKTFAISITVKDQDKRICAQIANETKAKLQAFIIKYRTSKAKNDFVYYDKLCKEAKADYEKARRKYASFSDSNIDVQLNSVKLLVDDLENDMQLKFNVYSTVNNQRQAALAKIQESTPAFTTIKSATVPTRPAGPKRMIISIATTIAAAMGLLLYYLRKDVC